MGALNRLPGLEVLVHLEEMLDFEAVKLRNVLDLSTPRCALIRRGNTQDLVVPALLIGHAEHTECAATNHTTRESGLFKEDEGVKRITVFTEGVINEAVIIGIPCRSEEHTVKADASRLVIDLVLVPVPLRDLNGHIEFHRELLHIAPSD